MFFKAKQQEASFRKMENRLHALEERLSTGNTCLEKLNRTVCQLDSNLNQNHTNLDSMLSQSTAKLDSLHSTVQKHDMALEDLLDEWAEKQSDATNVRERFREFEQQEKKLLELFETFQEQFQSLKRFAKSNDDALASQIALMEQALERSRRLCGISVIQECGVDVDYDLHEIVEAVNTNDPRLDKKIADIYRCGYIYKGTVKKKAQAAAYRLVNKTENPDCSSQL